MSGTNNKTVANMVEWFQNQTIDNQLIVAKELFSIAVFTDNLRIRSVENAQEIADEEGGTVEQWLAPYCPHSGDGIIEA